MMTSNQLNTNDLSRSQLSKVRKLIENVKLPALNLRKLPQGAADHYSYKITIQDCAKQQIIECNQYEMAENVKSLINCVEKFSSKRKSKNISEHN